MGGILLIAKYLARPCIGSQMLTRADPKELKFDIYTRKPLTNVGLIGYLGTFDSKDAKTITTQEGDEFRLAGRYSKAATGNTSWIAPA